MSSLYLHRLRLCASMPLLYLCIGCGFAASRAESLRLSVKLTILLAATPPEAKPPLF